MFTGKFYENYGKQPFHYTSLAKINIMFHYLYPSLPSIIIFNSRASLYYTIYLLFTATTIIPFLPILHYIITLQVFAFFAIVLIRLCLINNAYTSQYQSILFINLKIKQVE